MRAALEVEDGRPEVEAREASERGLAGHSVQPPCRADHTLPRRGEGRVVVGERGHRLARPRGDEDAAVVRVAEELEEEAAEPRAGRVVVEDALEQDAPHELELLRRRVGAGQVRAALVGLLEEAVLGAQHLAPEERVHLGRQPALVLALLGEAVLVEEGHLRDRTEIVRH